MVDAILNSQLFAVVIGILLTTFTA